ncbi:MAG: diaminopropionate ammonia-lyase [Pseudomonadota bacterium]
MNARVHARITDSAVHVPNVAVSAAPEYPGELDASLSTAEAASARSEIETWPGYAPTPCVALPGLAAHLQLGALHYKDEGGRFGLGSFKALGGAYAVFRVLADAVRDATGDYPEAAALAAGALQEVTRSFTVCCATDGNHGRAVAWGAQQFGCQAVIFVHETVSEGRVEAMARYGAEVIRHPGNYDETVARAAEDAAANGWTVVSDTAWPGYMEIPRYVMHGYCLMCAEALRQLGEPPTHVLVPAGVGGVAAAVTAATWWAFHADRPRIIVVEPDNAACLMESAAAGELTALHGDIETVMAGLSCGEPSPLAWPVLHAGAHDFVAVSDAEAVEAMRTLANPVGDDAAVVSGESAASTIAVLEKALRAPSLRDALQLTGDSRVLAFGTEGDTDPVLYESLVGRTADAVRGKSSAAQ